MAARKHKRTAQQLRQDQTDAEAKLWSKLRNRQLSGHKFRRQVPIESFVVDFVCYEARLVIEVDGGQHDDQAEKDARRTEILVDAGFRVIRFWNNEVLGNCEGVLETIAAALAGSSSPSP